MEVLDLFQADTPFYQQSAKGRVEADASQRLFGDQSLRLTTAGSQGQLNLRADLGQPLDLSHRNLMLWLRVDGHEHLDAVTLYVGSTEMAAYAVYPVAVGGTANNELYAHDGEWYAITVSLGDPAAMQGVVDFTAIYSLQVSVSARSAGEVTVHVNGLATTAKPTRGAVTVMFDDARDTVFTHALPVLAELGLTATVSVIADLAGESSFMSVQQLLALQDDHGWEVVAHHKSPLAASASFDRLPAAALAEELTGVRAWMLENELTSGVDAVSYPHGGIDLEAESIVRRYFDRGRTTVRSVGLETTPPANPLRLRAYVVRDIDEPDDLMRLVDRATASGGWLILVFHQLVEGDPLFQTSYRLADFQTVMEKVADSGLEVIGLSR